MDRESIFFIISQNIKKIEKYGVKNIGLLGSYSKNVYNKDSDIDIIVEFNEEQKNFDNYFDLKFFLEDLLNANVDLVLRDVIKSSIQEEIEKTTIYIK